MNILRCVASFAAMLSLVPPAAAKPPEPTDARVSTLVPAGFQAHDARLSRVRIHYWIGGSGPPLLLLHGWPETSLEWRGVAPLLARRFTVIVPDLRGMGDSSLEPSGYDKKTLAQDMHELMGKLGFARATLVGHDWGGPVAYAYAAQFRDGVDKLVMIEGAPFGPWMARTNLAWFFDFFRIPGYAEWIVTGREREFLGWFYETPSYHVVPEAFDPATVDAYMRAYARKDRMQATYGLYRAIDQDVRDNSQFTRQKLTIPVLAIGAETGAGEVTFDSARHAASNVTTMMFRNTGHFIPEERPQLLAERILAFIDGKRVPAEVRP